MDPSPRSIELLHYPGQWNLELTGICYSTVPQYLRDNTQSISVCITNVRKYELDLTLTAYDPVVPQTFKSCLHQLFCEQTTNCITSQTLLLIFVVNQLFCEQTTNCITSQTLLLINCFVSRPLTALLVKLCC